MSGGLGAADIRRQLQTLKVPADIINHAQAKVERAAGLIRSAPPAVALDESLLCGAWYTGPRTSDRTWPAVRQQLASVLPTDALESVDQASSIVVSLLCPPGIPAFATKGLVLGFVQSGKTTNFASVIAKAADAGYRMVVVLSGMHNSLRRQTQERLQGLLHETTENLWWMFSDENEDFINPSDKNINTLLADQGKRFLTVIKSSTMRRIRLPLTPHRRKIFSSGLESMTSLSGCSTGTRPHMSAIRRHRSQIC
jgi:hypothetical protein